MLIPETIEHLRGFYPISPAEKNNDVWSAWFLPENQSLPLTLCWAEDSQGITCIQALGRVPPEGVAELPLSLMAANLAVEQMGGPKFGYARSANMLTLSEFIPAALLQDKSLYEMKDIIDNLITRTRECQISFEQNGFMLNVSAEASR